MDLDLKGPYPENFDILVPWTMAVTGQLGALSCTALIDKSYETGPYLQGRCGLNRMKCDQNSLRISFLVLWPLCEFLNFEN